LINELDKQFLAQEVLNVIGIVYLQYWLQPNVEHMFVGQLVLLKAQYCFLKIISDDGVVFPTLLDGLK
jgi:hypothetical protein